MPWAYGILNKERGQVMGRELFDGVFQSILAAEVSRDVVEDNERRRNSFLELLLEISAPLQPEGEFDLLLAA